MSKRKKTPIPKVIKQLVWNTYIGEHNGNGLCQCCNTATISQMNFHCGHIVSEFDGGKITVDNLKPICPLCNSSMGTQNMDEFIENHGLDKVIKETLETTRSKKNYEEKIREELEGKIRKELEEEKLMKEFVEEKLGDINNNQCVYCLKIFSRSDSLSRHASKYCKVKIDSAKNEQLKKKQEETKKQEFNEEINKMTQEVMEQLKKEFSLEKGNKIYY